MNTEPTEQEIIDTCKSIDRYIESGAVSLDEDLYRVVSKWHLIELAKAKAELEGRAQSVTLTTEQIKDLAQFVGLRVEGEIDADDKENEIVIIICPERGVKSDDGAVTHYRHIAYCEEYPEEGVCPLGPAIIAPPAARNGQ